MNTRKVLMSGIGGSFVISIPSNYCKSHDIKKGDIFKVEVDELGRLIYTQLKDPDAEAPVNIFGGENE